MHLLFLTNSGQKSSKAGARTTASKHASVITMTWLFCTSCFRASLGRYHIRSFYGTLKSISF